ncbi:hypothetical protein PMAYCL1PPCAC_11724, partial [Pristionchus mayeri]
LLQLDQLLDAVVHLLDGLVLGQAKASLQEYGDDSSGRVGVLTVDAADLELQSIAHLQSIGLGRDLGQFDVHGGTDGRAKVGGAEGEIAEAFVSQEGRLLLDGLDSLDETGQHLSDVSSILHRDDTEMVLLVHPHQEGLRLVVVDTTTIGPEAAGIGLLQESVALLEEEVVLDQLVLDVLGHSLQ